MENFSREIIDLICDDWKDDEQLIIDALLYLYKTSNDDKMKSQIKDIFIDYGYCLSCGTKLEIREIKEVHDELDDNPVEYLTEIYCPNCDK